MSKVTLKSLSEELEALRQHLAALTAKIGELEGAAAAAPSGSVEVEAEEKVVPREPEEIPDEIMLAISAAVAAYLGTRAPIRTVRLLGSTAWAQEGRVSIQASHRLNVQHHTLRVR
ncbi:MAG: hypothetical protein J0H49_17960 [Acidobacteria bacterium]|nr:hypothetical protein [Acidobacteriota bacterium]